ncbi:MAG: hypothetical protein U0169_06810 [Polyangiaceae bacterium]
MAVGELDEDLALSATCATLDLPGVWCALVRSRTEDAVVELDVFGSEDATRFRAVMTRLASRSDGRRVYQSVRDPSWSEAFDEASPPPRGTRWFACEPVALDVESLTGTRADSARLVLLGISDACKDDARRAALYRPIVCGHPRTAPSGDARRGNRAPAREPARVDPGQRRIRNLAAGRPGGRRRGPRARARWRSAWR